MHLISSAYICDSTDHIILIICLVVQPFQYTPGSPRAGSVSILRWFLAHRRRPVYRCWAVFLKCFVLLSLDGISLLAEAVALFFVTSFIWYIVNRVSCVPVSFPDSEINPRSFSLSVWATRLKRKEMNRHSCDSVQRSNSWSHFPIHCTCLSSTYQVIVILLSSGIMQQLKVNYKSKTFIPFGKSCINKENLKEKSSVNIVVFLN